MLTTQKQSLPATPSRRKSRKNSAVTLTTRSTSTSKTTATAVLAKRLAGWCVFCSARRGCHVDTVLNPEIDCWWKGDNVRGEKTYVLYPVAGFDYSRSPFFFYVAYLESGVLVLPTTFFII